MSWIRKTKDAEESSAVSVNAALDPSILIKVNNLYTYFFTEDGTVRAVDGVSIQIEQGKILGVIGETGCGKSVLALSIMRLVLPPGRTIRGNILYRHNDTILDLARLDPMGDVMRDIRGKGIAMIFQEPMISLNPVYTIGEQIVEAIIIHQNISKKEALEHAIRMLEEVGIPDPQKRVDDYPHQLSGGMRQRAMIAMALSCNPKVLIADEPTTALDVTVQAQILELLKKIQKEFGMSIMMITHNLGVVAEMSDNVAVMYLGKVVEYTDKYKLFDTPLHPYTQALLKSIPSLAMYGGVKKKLETIKGVIPDPYTVIEGCSFKDRCPAIMDICQKEEPTLIEAEKGHYTKCWLYG